MMLGRRKRETVRTEEQALLEDLFAAKSQRDDARRKFDYVTEPEMVASCIYQMHALQERYSYLLSRVREQELTGALRWRG